MSKVTRILCRSFDLLLFLVLVAAEYAIARWFQPHRRGFFCGDESLQYPLRPSTVNVGVLSAIVLGLPVVSIVVVELSRQLSAAAVAAGLDKRHAQLHSDGTVRRPYRLGYRLHCCYAQLGYFLCGLLMTLIATEIPKRAVGRLRPHFFAVCQPQLANGTDCSHPSNMGHYFETFECLNAQGDPDFVLRQLNQSFPSGHASMTTFAMLYLSLYLQVALSTRGSKLLKHLLQFGFMLLAWWVALTRVVDYWHHWSDTLVGLVLGGSMAVLVARYMARLFARSVSTTRLALAPSTLALASAHSSSPVLPAYTFGSMPYLQHHHAAAAAAAAAANQHPAYAQTYQNYGYVP